MNRGAFSLCWACFARSGSHAPALPVLAQSRLHCQRSLCHRRWKLGSLAASAFGLSSFISSVRCVFTASCTAAWLQRFVLVHRLRRLAAFSACGELDGVTDSWSLRGYHGNRASYLLVGRRRFQILMTAKRLLQLTSSLILCLIQGIALGPHASGHAVFVESLPSEHSVLLSSWCVWLSAQLWLS